MVGHAFGVERIGARRLEDRPDDAAQFLRAFRDHLVSVRFAPSAGRRARPQCFSNELYKGILDDRSTGVFNGKVLVRLDAQQTNAYQSNKSILLTDTARMYSKPELEIYADDVKCSHGATTGQLDEDALFYLRSRGLTKKRARALLLTAFARDVLDNVVVEPLRVYLDTLVTARF